MIWSLNLRFTNMLLQPLSCSIFLHYILYFSKGAKTKYTKDHNFGKEGQASPNPI